MVAAFVDDGYNESARIVAADGVYPAVSFRFRPVTAGEFSEYAHKLEMADAAETKQVTAEFLVGKVIDWDLRSVDGMRVPITIENVLKLKHIVYLKLFQIIIGDEPGDPDNTRLFAIDVTENDSKNSIEGVRLQMLHPQIAARDCTHCEAHVYDERTGKATKYPRPAGTFAPCRYGADRCPKGTPETSRALSQKNRQAYRHYLICKAVGMFPDDSVVHRNAGLIRRIEDEIAERRRRELVSCLAVLPGIVERANR